MPRTTRMEVSLSHYRNNLKFFQNILKTTKISACVKANAYGHGLQRMAQEAESLVSSFSVATVDEGVLLREVGIKQDIIVLSPHSVDEISEIAQYQLQPLLSDSLLLEAYAKTNKDISVHLKIDTGMGRLGCLPSEACDLVKKVKEYSNIQIAGICTHFSDSENDLECTKQQIQKFEQAIRLLAGQGFSAPVRHACNSGGVLSSPEAHYDMARIGAGSYGYVLDEYPHPQCPELRLCASLKSKIVLTRKVPVGTRISYGGTFTTKKDSVIGIVPIGYADGLPVSLSNKAHFLIDNKPVPVLGRICMDQCVVDLTRIPNPLMKDVLIFGDHPVQNITRLVQNTDSRVSSVLTLIPSRVPRIYLP